MFRFKQFSVCHDQCAMKVGTDGVLLGSWADCKNSRLILDVGTGSGLIALMLAQRSEARIHALDLDEGAFRQASFNAVQSPFGNRINVFHSSFQNFSPDVKYDLIVSNPPYFNLSLKSPDQQRTHARHNDSLSLDVLINKGASLLTEKGKLALVLPTDLYPEAENAASENGLYLIRKTNVKPLPVSLSKRVLLEYSLISEELTEKDLVIEISRHRYSDDYIALTNSFYLKM